MDTIKTIDADRFKTPSTIPQDLLLIHDLVGGDLEASSSSRALTAERHDPLATDTTKAEEDDTDSIASSSGEDSLDDAGDVNMLKRDPPSKEEGAEKGADSEEEVEAGLLDRDEDGDPMTM
jgi:hypothetical protein